MMDMEIICQEAVNHFGSESRVMLAIEEMAELQKELCKHSRGKDNYYNIAEEIADVLIMAEQLMILFDCRNTVKEWQYAKLMRLKELMNDGTD